MLEIPKMTGKNQYERTRSKISTKRERLSNKSGKNKSDSLSHFWSLLSFGYYMMPSIRKKIRFLLFYLFNVHENEFSFT